MERVPHPAAVVVFALLVLAVATLMAGCTQQQPLTVKITDHATYGRILTDSTGRSLYIIARDVPNTGSVANLGEISRYYPPFYAESVIGGNGINISEYGHITRADGQRQTTFRGWPLYYYLNDREPGDAKSQGANNITFLAKPDYTVMVRENVTLGVYLTDTAGAPLLARENDTAAAPPPGYAPFQVSPVVGPSPLVQPDDFGEVRAASGEVQTTYRGQPLYVPGDRARAGAIPINSTGFQAVILARGGALTVVEATTAAPSPSATVADLRTATPTISVRTTAATTATTRSENDAYTGGVHTPTPFQTVQVVRHDTESATPAPVWTPITTGAATVAPVTPAPTVSNLPTTSPPLTVPTTRAATVTTRATIVPTTAATTIGTSVTTPPATTLPTSIPTTTATTVPIPVTTLPTTVPMPITTPPTTLPLPFPITTVSNPLASPGGNGS